MSASNLSGHPAFLLSVLVDGHSDKTPIARDRFLRNHRD